MQRLLGYIRNSYEELTHVKWPTRSQLIELTLIVIGVTLGVALFTFLFDSLFTFGFQYLLSLKQQ